MNGRFSGEGWECERFFFWRRADFEAAWSIFLAKRTPEQALKKAVNVI
jgi:hypothetical protein